MSEWGAMGDWRLFFLHRDRLREVSAEDVQRVAVSYLKPSNRTVGFFIPDDNPDRAEIPVAPDVASLVEGYTGDEAVAEGEAFDPSPANIDRRTMSSAFASGMEIALLPKETRGETVVASVTLRFGDEEALAGRGSAGSLAASMLMRGTVNRTRQEIQDEMNRLQAQVGVGGGGATASGRVQATRENFPDALRLLTEVLREPSFPEDEFETLKEQRLAALESQKSEPQIQAILALQRHMNPREPGHPQYTATVEESIAEMEALTLADVTDFHDTFYGTGAATMSIVGDFDDDEALSIIEEGLGDWTSPVTFTRIDRPFEEIAPEDLQIETPDKANAFFVAGQVLPMTDSHEDVAALTMANYLLGGGFLNSRLATRIVPPGGRVELRCRFTADLPPHRPLWPIPGLRHLRARKQGQGRGRVPRRSPQGARRGLHRGRGGGRNQRLPREREPHARPGSGPGRGSRQQPVLRPHHGMAGGSGGGDSVADRRTDQRCRTPLDRPGEDDVREGGRLCQCGKGDPLTA